MSEEQVRQVEEIKKQSHNMVKDAFRAFKDHGKRMADDRKEFEEMDKGITERMNRGVRRTSGRII